jgi:hypothetical protein
MLIISHIPTEQYGFIELHHDRTHPEDIHREYMEYSEAFKVKEGLSTKEFNTALDRYLLDHTGETETYLAMSPEQQRVFQEIKKALKRIKSKEELPIVEKE